LSTEVTVARRRWELDALYRTATGLAQDDEQVTALLLLHLADGQPLHHPGHGAVMAASIFIASMEATLCPAFTVSPSATLRVTTPANGAAT
jgi:hypothetical protein